MKQFQYKLSSIDSISGIILFLIFKKSWILVYMEENWVNAMLKYGFNIIALICHMILL